MGTKRILLQNRQTKIRTHRLWYPQLTTILILVAANAGIDDSQDLYNPASADGVTKPNYKTIEVDLYGPLYATQLALHYFRTNSPNTGGKIVVTSSAAGLYGSPPQPQYGVAKFGLIGLTRSMGGNKGLLKENITINAVCPSFVRTGLAPKDFVKSDPLMGLTDG
jgi:15-hydroxyprostaglandin dehydrogenase (NAD)